MYSLALALPQHDDQKVTEYGVSLAVKMVRRLVDEGGLRGFHFCTLNLEKSVERVLENLEWTPRHARVQNKLIAASIRKVDELGLMDETGSHPGQPNLPQPRTPN